jgi:hypothetical protein
LISFPFSMQVLWLDSVGSNSQPFF